MAGNDDYYDVWLEMVGRVSRPRFRELLLRRAGVDLDPELAQYLVTVGLRGPIGVVELAGMLDSNHPKASRSIARLAELGLVDRADSVQDRRIKTVFLTAQGHRVVDAINQGRRRLLDEAFVGWTERDKESLARLTRRLSDRMVELIDSLPASPRDEPGVVDDAGVDGVSSRAGRPGHGR